MSKPVEIEAVAAKPAGGSGARGIAGDRPAAAADAKAAALRRLAAAFTRDRGGASAVEFAILILPFLAVLTAIVQTALVLWASQNLDHALQKAVRTLFVGDFQNTYAGQTNSTVLLNSLRANLCGPGSVNKLVLFDCTNVLMDVAVSGSFAGVPSPNPVNTSNGTWNTSFGKSYACADPGTIVIVTAAVKYPLAFGLLNPAFKTFADGTRMLMSTAVFRTEPYQPTNGTSSC